ncbi:Sirohydrochlorin cobaltochelatase [Candidatus Methanobinarius endosymbioticus]|uniref:Sirohydrochlorin cobaltochelatase n=1 Tax=Candidatus Methanobinarius endosymbioticus TaxID=2006182 RepID=A0A366MBC3_9EURY|nr:Sirohydrochlorin cobaltochelatase [Candidatus Methanobinarius endosymbioticus]
MDSNLSQLNESNNSANYKELNMSNNPEDFGVLLISHGSSLPYAEKTFQTILNKYIEKTGHNTEVGYMKAAKPSIPEAIDNLLAKNNNIKRILAIPVFLAPGIHTNIDIPIMLGLDQLERDPRCPDGIYPEDHYLKESKPVEFSGEIDLMECIGPDPSIIDIINNRISSVIEGSAKNIGADKTAVLLVSHGSRLNYNREFITDIYNQYKNQSNYSAGQGFMELCKPTIAESINQMTENNEFERLIVVPVFLAPGVHTTRDIPNILGILDDDRTDSTHDHSHNHENSNHDNSHDHTHGDNVEFDGEILYCEPLGSDNIIIDIIENRIENRI